MAFYYRHTGVMEHVLIGIAGSAKWLSITDTLEHVLSRYYRGEIVFLYYQTKWEEYLLASFKKIGFLEVWSIL